MEIKLLSILLLITFLVGCTTQQTSELRLTKETKTNIEEVPLQGKNDTTSIQEKKDMSLAEVTSKNDKTIAKNLNDSNINGADLSNVLKYFEAFKSQSVVGDSATAESITGITLITILMQNEMSVEPVRLASEIKNLNAQNIISVGNACENKVTADLLDVPTYLLNVPKGSANPTKNCLTGIEKNKGYIKLMPNGNKLALLIYGYTSNDTLKTVIFFTNLNSWKAGNLNNKFKAMISGDSSRLIYTSGNSTCINCNLENFELSGTEVEINTSNIVVNFK